MEAALAEFRAEDVGMDVEEDVDFVVEKGTVCSLNILPLIVTSCIRRRRGRIRVGL